MEQTWEEMRHVENLREKVTVIVVTVSTAIIGFIMQQKFAIETKPLMGFVIVLGIFGSLMVLKLYHIHQRDQRRLDKWYQYYEKACGDNPQILLLRDEADDETGKFFFPISKLKHHYFWSLIHLFVTAAGIFFLLTSYPENKPKTFDRASPKGSKNFKVDSTVKL
ncbi:hypothetical protein [Fibrella aestuarina]|uniref:hypothetical protein n=1 Tax=Fibrella aestuarina TaxID=651143 RepID=UPI0011D23F02|nr:hypothetical protein [Fibrella aestuarina]